MSESPAIYARAFRVEMGQGWRTSLIHAVQSLNHASIYAKGYGDDSTTTYAVCFTVAHACTVDDITGYLRRLLAFEGWMRVDLD